MYMHKVLEYTIPMRFLGSMCVHIVYIQLKRGSGVQGGLGGLLLVAQLLVDHVGDVLVPGACTKGRSELRGPDSVV